MEASGKLRMMRSYEAHNARACSRLETTSLSPNQEGFDSVACKDQTFEARRRGLCRPLDCIEVTHQCEIRDRTSQMMTRLQLTQSLENQGGDTEFMQTHQAPKKQVTEHLIIDTEMDLIKSAKRLINDKVLQE